MYRNAVETHGYNATTRQKKKQRGTISKPRNAFSFPEFIIGGRPDIVGPLMFSFAHLSRVRMRNDRDVPSPHHLRGRRLEGVGRRRRAEAESEWRYYAGKDEDEEEERKADEGGGQSGVHAAAR